MQSSNASRKGEPGRKTNIKGTCYNEPKFNLTIRDANDTKISMTVRGTTSWLALKIAFARSLNLDDDAVHSSCLLHDGHRMDMHSNCVASTLPQDAVEDATAKREVIIEWQMNSGSG